MVAASKTGTSKPIQKYARLWYAPDRRIRTKLAADRARSVVKWAEVGSGLSAEPDEQMLFAALHTCAFHAVKRANGKRVVLKQRAEWARKWSVIRDYIVKRNFPLIYSMMAKFQSADLDRDDMLSEAMYGLVQAAERFNPWRGFRFSTYACHAIRRSMIRGSRQARSYRRRFPVQHEIVYEQPYYPEAGRDLYLERLQRALDHNLGELTDIETRILAKRFPTDNERRSTLQEIGDVVGLSKERVRQLQTSLPSPTESAQTAA